jgi:Protein of unknown function (DUF1440)
MKKNLFAGAMAGALGGLAMKAVVYFVDRDSFGLSTRTDARATHEVWRRLNRTPVSQKSAEQIGAAMHYGFAIAAGALYAAAATKFPSTRLGRGAAFGAALWLVGDELAVSASGLEHPFRIPIPSHLSALAAHILYGMIVDSVQRARSGALSLRGVR